MTAFFQSVIDALSVGSLYALMALGIGLIFGIMRLVNFAHGELVMIGGYTMLVLASAPGALTAVLTILIVMILALGMERVAFRPLREASLPTLLVASFAVSFFLQNAVVMAYGGNTVGVSFAPALTRSLEFSGLRIPYLQIVTLGTTVALVAGLAMFLKRTRFGTQMRAAAEDFRMARLMGVRANLVIGVAFAVSGILASVVSLLYVTQVGTLTPQMGIQPALIGFVATVVGGLGSLLGATIGGFFIGTLIVTLQILLPLELRPFRDAFVFSILFMVLLFRPGGLIVVPWAKERV